MATLTSASWANALDVSIKHQFELGFNRRPPVGPALYNMQGSTLAAEKVSGVGATGVDAWNTYANSGVVGHADFDQGYKTTYTHIEYPLEMGVKRATFEDSQFNEIFKLAKRVGASAQVKREIDAASTFVNGFDDNFAGADAVGLMSTAHPYSPDKTGSTQSNEGTLVLNKANLSTTRQLHMAMVDDTGELMGIQPDILLVPPELEDKALELTVSGKDPESANNTFNTQSNRWMVVVWHYLTDATAWFTIDSSLMDDSLDWFNRVPLSIVPKVEDKTIEAHWIGYMRYSYGWSDYRWIYGQNG